MPRDKLDLRLPSINSSLQNNKNDDNDDMTIFQGIKLMAKVLFLHFLHL